MSDAGPADGRARVALVDDSVVVRRALARALASEPDLNVVATLPTGAHLLSRLEIGGIDAVVLDIEMPELDGLETLRRVRARWPSLPVVMCSSLTERGAAATVEALSLGASDYVTKPSSARSFADALTTVGRELGQKLRGLTSRRRDAVVTTSPTFVGSATGSTKSPRRLARPDILAIACSTGGPNALIELWRSLPRSLPVPVVIVQHMPPVFTRMLAERMTALGGIPVREGVEGETLVAGEARIAPGGLHMELVGAPGRVQVHLQDDPPENSCRPAADVLFRSVARIHGASSLALVLTGMGQDALVGSRAIVEAGGQVLAQDEATSVVWGMPGYVARAGLAAQVLALPEIGPSAVRILLHAWRRESSANAPGEGRV